MKKSSWITAFLIASWTLNVALLVAYYMKTTYPPGATLDIPVRPGPMFPLPDIPCEIRDGFRAETAPLHETQSRLISGISSAIAVDELDTVLLATLSDSLNLVRCELQRRLMSHLGYLHGKLPAEGRFRMSQRLNRMMKGHMSGPSGGKHKRFQQRFNPDPKGR